MSKKQLISKSKLEPLLIEHGFIAKPDNRATSSISYEAYGRKVMAYIHLSDPSKRPALEAFLTGRNLKVNGSYWPGGATVEVQVSYFKAPHWDE